MDTKEYETWQIRRVGPAASCRDVLNVMILNHGVNSFGRSPNNTFFLDSKILKNFISRNHADIVCETLEDGEVAYKLVEKGLNGTFVNDVRIKGKRVLEDGDKITFGHTNGYKIQPGQYSLQQHSEFQFIFERCPDHNGGISKENGINSVDYHQTQTYCGSRKLPSSPDYDRSECCENSDKHSALKTSRSPVTAKNSAQKHNKENCLKQDNMICYRERVSNGRRASSSPDVPDIMEEVEILEGKNSPESTSMCHSEHYVIEVTTRDHITPSTSPDINKDDLLSSSYHSKDKKDSSNMCIESGVNSQDELKKCNSVSSSRASSSQSLSRPSSAKSSTSSSYDECDGEVRNIWTSISSCTNEQKSNETDTVVSGTPITDKQEESYDSIPSTNNDLLRLEDLEKSMSLKKQAADTYTFSEDSDRERCLQVIHHNIEELLGALETDNDYVDVNGKSSDTRSVTHSSGGSAKKRKKKKIVSTRPKRPKMKSAEEKLEDGVEWYEEDTCSAPDCTKPASRRVQWVQCDDCDKWFHTVCAGCRYDDVKDSQMEFHCGC